MACGNAEWINALQQQQVTPALPSMIASLLQELHPLCCQLVVHCLRLLLNSLLSALLHSVSSLCRLVLRNNKVQQEPEGTAFHVDGIWLASLGSVGAWCRENMKDLSDPAIREVVEKCKRKTCPKWYKNIYCINTRQCKTRETRLHWGWMYN